LNDLAIIIYILTFVLLQPSIPSISRNRTPKTGVVPSLYTAHVACMLSNTMEEVYRLQYVTDSRGEGGGMSGIACQSLGTLSFDMASVGAGGVGRVATPRGPATPGATAAFGSADKDADSVGGNDSANSSAIKAPQLILPDADEEDDEEEEGDKSSDDSGEEGGEDEHQPPRRSARTSASNSPDDEEMEVEEEGEAMDIGDDQDDVEDEEGASGEDEPSSRRGGGRRSARGRGSGPASNGKPGAKAGAKASAGDAGGDAPAGGEAAGEGEAAGKPSGRGGSKKR
jgi:hypothetical protein